MKPRRLFTATDDERVSRVASLRLLPHLIRLRDARSDLAMDRNKFNSETGPALTEVWLGSQPMAFDDGSGSSVTFELNGERAHFHRPHPQKEALRYRVRDVRTFLERLGVEP